VLDDVVVEADEGVLPSKSGERGTASWPGGAATP
jgi:hypothetical protein